MDSDVEANKPGTAKTFGMTATRCKSGLSQSVQDPTVSLFKLISLRERNAFHNAAIFPLVQKMEGRKLSDPIDKAIRTGIGLEIR